MKAYEGLTGKGIEVEFTEISPDILNGINDLWERFNMLPTVSAEYLIPLGRGRYLYISEPIEIIGEVESLFPVDIQIETRFLREERTSSTSPNLNPGD
jgi:hypothetical protein